MMMMMVVVVVVIMTTIQFHNTAFRPGVPSKEVPQIAKVGTSTHPKQYIHCICSLEIQYLDLQKWPHTVIGVKPKSRRVFV